MSPSLCCFSLVVAASHQDRRVLEKQAPKFYLHSSILSSPTPGHLQGEQLS